MAEQGGEREDCRKKGVKGKRRGGKAMEIIYSSLLSLSVSLFLSLRCFVLVSVSQPLSLSFLLCVMV
jgi:hypothetical protein